MSTAAVYRGGCHCGAVRFEALGPATNVCVCHCQSCRRSSGAPMVPWATFARSGFRLRAGALTHYASSPPVQRGFCARCGTSLTYTHADQADEIDVTLTSLDQAASLSPTMHIWTADKLPWVQIDDALPQFAHSSRDQAAQPS